MFHPCSGLSTVSSCLLFSRVFFSYFAWAKDEYIGMIEYIEIELCWYDLARDSSGGSYEPVPSTPTHNFLSLTTIGYHFFISSLRTNLPSTTPQYALL
mmetsp:Transcript_44933/g.45351  ORF Transcript_44933/g.45351 Transcript_44933/m.45351 type:complete len:98 (+) Transcript_44933:390-683(+)